MSAPQSGLSRSLRSRHFRLWSTYALVSDVVAEMVGEEGLSNAVALNATHSTARAWSTARWPACGAREPLNTSRRSAPSSTHQVTR